MTVDQNIQFCCASASLDASVDNGFCGRSHSPAEGRNVIATWASRAFSLSGAASDLG
jgi:hypothetical protein